MLCARHRKLACHRRPPDHQRFQPILPFFFSSLLMLLLPLLLWSDFNFIYGRCCLSVLHEKQVHGKHSPHSLFGSTISIMNIVRAKEHFDIVIKFRSNESRVEWVRWALYFFILYILLACLLHWWKRIPVMTCYFSWRSMTLSGRKRMNWNVSSACALLMWRDCCCSVEEDIDTIWERLWLRLADDWAISIMDVVF